MLAYIPSPSHGILHIGPFALHAYGLMLAIGVLVAARIADVRWSRTGNNPKVIAEIAVPVVVAGVVGARVYHLFTGYKWSTGGIVGAFEIWKGGLSIWGAVGGGLIAVVVLARRKHLDTLTLLDAVGPGVVVAQGIGRWGNYFNQELFGRPSKLPWALEIDLAHRPLHYERFATFQPTFLYESVWCLVIFATIVWIERHRGLRKGQAFTLYVAMYTFGRCFFEWLRVDPASKIFGIRFNLLLSAVLCVIGVISFVRLGRRPEPSPIASGPVPGGIPTADQGSSG
ncbi:MAG TPA: prolipoprotein diacylglyceryl transferase [Acidimicrobiia bacterium]|jgi:prolipoprotein diacylglyceryl transferase|nr:prolipoprotein diacylglyceryl transferase [Acidimicrobiia bacterium]